MKVNVTSLRALQAEFEIVNSLCSYSKLLTKTRDFAKARVARTQMQKFKSDRRACLQRFISRLTKTAKQSDLKVIFERSFFSPKFVGEFFVEDKTLYVR